jgi:hypothetical protein
MSDELICFVHIPKTAGVSLMHVLAEQYGKQRMLQDTSTFEFKNFWSRYGNWTTPEMRVLCGHIPYGYHRVDPRTRYITLLRDPISRIVSDYNHLRRDKLRVFHSEAARSVSLREFIETTSYRWIDNPMVRFISGEDPPMRGVELSHLELARENLHQFHFGTDEELPEAMKRFAQAFGWDPVPTLPRMHAAPLPPSPLSASDFDAASEITDLDSQLYEYAYILLGGRTSKEPPDLRMVEDGGEAAGKVLDR